jgi:hypothetical protein
VFECCLLDISEFNDWEILSKIDLLKISLS